MEVETAALVCMVHYTSLGLAFQVLFYFLRDPKSLLPSPSFPASIQRFHSDTPKLTPTIQIRAAEDILSLTRVLKETWLYGKLQTVGTSEAEVRAEVAAAKVAEGLAGLDSSNRTTTRSGECEEAV